MWKERNSRVGEEKKEKIPASSSLSFLFIIILIITIILFFFLPLGLYSPSCAKLDAFSLIYHSFVEYALPSAGCV